MTVVSSKRKYLATESIFRKAITVEEALEGGYGGYAEASEYDKVLEPDEDFYRALSAEEFRERLIEVVEKIDKKYAHQ